MSLTTLVNPDNGGQNQPGQPSNSVDDLLKGMDAEIAAATPAGGQQQQTNQDPANGKPAWIEDKFWTGDVETSAQKMSEAYSNLQSAHGRMANDLGVQRKLTDRLLALSPADSPAEPAKQHEPIEIDSGQLLDNPTQTFDKVLAAHAARMEEATNARLNNIEQSLHQYAFVNKHPDVDQISNDPNFHTWVQSDPLRANAAQAAINGDYMTADLLLSQYKAQVAAAGQGAGAASGVPGTNGDAEAAKATAAQVQQVTLESNASESGGGNSGTIYSRQALMELRVNNPAKYNDPQFQAVMTKAYREGRVR